MSDRKYRQRGYQDDNRDRPPKPAARKPPEPGAPAGARRISQDGPRNINMRCGTDLHACSQCTSFDPGSRFECMEPTLTARISPKNARNSCPLFTPRTTVERETTAPRSDDARKAFDDLFKF
jgi:hypothetical protein